MSIVVPTADDHQPGAPRTVAVVTVLAVGVVLAIWPAVPFATSPVPRAAVVGAGAPPVAAPVAAGAIWTSPIPLPTADSRVVGVGDAVLAVAPTGLWPVSLLVGEEWRRLLGFPAGFTVADGVGASTGDGFVVAGVEADRTVLYRFSPDGRFTGARTLFGIRAGVLLTVGSTSMVFDEAARRAVVVGTAPHIVELPGAVVAAVEKDGTAAIVTDGGDLYVTSDHGSTWEWRGEGFVDVVAADAIHAVGATASTGLHRLDADGWPVRRPHAPFGPTAGSREGIVVFDWSTSGAWVADSDGWRRIPFWNSAGFVGTFEGFVAGADTLTVVTVDADGSRLVQTVRR